MYKSLGRGPMTGLVLVTVIGLVGLFWLSNRNAQASFTATPTSSIWGASDGSVLAIASGSNGLIYVGGSFTFAGKATGRAALANTTTHVISSAFRKLYGSGDQVIAAVPDGSSGWYFGGLASSGYGFIIHANSSGAQTFYVTVDSELDALAYDSGNNVLYAGGAFQQIDPDNLGPTRRYLAAFDGTTGAVTSFNPNPNSNVFALLMDGSTLYAGGGFTTVGGVAQKRLVAFDVTTGASTSFNPGINNGRIDSLAIDGTTLYAGGTFTTVGGSTTRNRLVAFDTGTGATTSFDPNISGGTTDVNTLVVNGATLYAGGAFTTVGGSTTRNNLVAFDTGTGATTSFDANMNGKVRALAVSGSTLYAGGDFTTAGGVSAKNMIGLDPSTGAITDSKLQTDGNVYALAAASSNLLIGGFQSIVGQTRNKLFAIDTTNDILADFNPNPNNTVFALLASGSTLYAGGRFTTVGSSTTRNKLAAFDLSTGATTSFNPGLNSDVNGLAIRGSSLYVGGAFTTVGTGTTRNGFVEFEIPSGATTSLDLNLLGGGKAVYSIVPTRSTLYIGGYFLGVSGTTRRMIAAVDPVTGAASASFHPNLGSSAPVNWIQMQGRTLYAGGSFTTGGGSSNGSYMAAFNVDTGASTSFHPVLTGTVNSLAVNGATVYAGGSFTSPHNRLAAFDSSTGSLASFDPNAGSTVNVLKIIGNTLYTGGAFTSIGGITHDRLVGLSYVNAGNPSITILGSNPISLTVGDSYTDAGATATDTDDGDLTSSIVTTGSVNTAAAGTYTITYTVTDFSGATDTKTRTVTVAAAAGSSCSGSLTVGVSVSGGSASAGDAVLFLDSTGMSRDTVYMLSCNTHIISASSLTNYSRAISGDCSSDGSVVIDRGSNKTCTVNYTYNSPAGGGGGGIAYNPSPTPTPTPSATPAPASGPLADHGLKEGDTVSAPGSSDPDVYIVNVYGFKRLFLNPVIFNFYGHLGGFSKVKTITSSVRDLFPTSGLFRNCETGEQAVYAVEVTGEDTGILHHVVLTGDQAVAQDPDFFKKVFCINTNEFNWYTKGSDYASLSQVPVYTRSAQPAMGLRIKVIDSVAYLNIRSTASIDGALIGQLQPGEIVEYTQISNGWYRIRKNGSDIGWVSGVYVTVLK